MSSLEVHAICHWISHWLCDRNDNVLLGFWVVFLFVANLGEIKIHILFVSLEKRMHENQRLCEDDDRKMNHFQPIADTGGDGRPQCVHSCAACFEPSPKMEVTGITIMIVHCFISF